MILSELRAGYDDPTNPALVFPDLLKLSLTVCRKSSGSYRNDFFANFLEHLIWNSMEVHFL
jgi:hypothetical protein